MGSSKKHKEKDKEHKRKRRHRSRSKDRKRHKGERQERERYEERVPDEQFEDENLDDYYPKELEEIDSTRVKSDSKSSGPVFQPSSASGDLSLSIEETNRIRAKLGLKPLEVNYETKDDDGVVRTAEGDIHKPAVSLTEQKKTAKVKEKIERVKEKRRLNDKLSKVKTLGESDSDEDASAWIEKSRKQQKEREMAEKRAKMLEEMDEEFGIGSLVDEEFHDKKKDYSSKDLKGLKVEHALDRFKEGQTVILTLQDKGILDEENDDALVNVNLIDEEKADKYKEDKKKKPDYNPYDEGDMDEYGMFKVKNILDKYDEEIDGPKRDKFELGSGGKYDGDQDRQMELIKAQLRQQSQSLGVQSLNMASEYLTQQEIEAAKFKKRKKKVRKIRKKEVLKADDLLPLPDQDIEPTDYGSRSHGRGYNSVPEVKQEYEDGGASQYNTENGGVYSSDTAGPIVIDYAHGQMPLKVEKDRYGEEKMELEKRIILEEDEPDLIGPEEDLTGVTVDDDAESELQAALTKARKLKQRREKPTAEKVAKKVLTEQQEELEDDDKKENSASIILNATSEFCRALGDIPTYGQSGNRDEEKEELMDYERELMEERKRREEEEEEQMSGWNRVEIDETPVNITGEEQAVLDEEPVVASGVGAALELAKKKGYLEKDAPKKVAGVRKVTKETLEAQNYSIEDKRYDDLDEKYRKRDRYGGHGLTQDFKEKDAYKPEIKLEYVDDTGRMLNQKEAFRQLSHRFHGKGSGKKKTEKRHKKLQEEQLMKQMSSTDTPLGTLNMLQEKQRTEKSPFIVLSGNKGLTSNSITKPN